MYKKIILSLFTLFIGSLNFSGASYIGDLVSSINTFSNKFVSFGNSIISVLSYIGSIFKTLWYGLTSLLSGVRQLIIDIYSGSLFTYISSGFSDLTFFIGKSGTLFFVSIFSLILISLIIGFVFKLFRLSTGNNKISTKWKD